MDKRILLTCSLTFILATLKVSAQVNSPNGNFNASTSGTSLTLQTNGTSRVTVVGGAGSNAGFVGVGTTNPSVKFDVFGLSGTVMRVGGTSAPGNIAFEVNNGGIRGLFESVIASPNQIRIGSPGAHNFSLFSSNLDRMTITADGKIGVGTASPVEMFHINGNIRGNQSGALRISTGSGHVDIGPQNGLFSHFMTDRSSYYFNKRIYVDEGIITSYDEPLTLQAAGLTAMTLLNGSGNVGIGTASPSEKLHINGAIRGNALGGSVRIKTEYGHVDIGPMNTEWAHFDTDRSKFYFNKPVYINGTLNSYGLNSLSLRTADTDRLTISSSGDVGIGTISPAYKLDVNGSINATSLYLNGTPFTGNSQWTTSGSDIYYGSGSVGIGTQTPLQKLHIKSATSNTYINIEKPSSSNEGGIMFSRGENTQFFIWSDNDDDALKIEASGLEGEVNATPRMQFPLANKNIYMAESGGNVGIGTNAPAERLHIDGAIRGNAEGGALRIKTANGFLDLGPMNSEWSNIQTDRARFYFNKPLYVDGSINSYNSNNLILRTGDEDRVTILQSNGNVGIGTTLSSNPNNYKLAVNGKIGAHEVRVEQTSAAWPDYVFSKDYELPSLAEVEGFIKQNNHLEDVPSAEDVKKNGHDLGSMDAVLLKKIEELTLYIIQQEKRLNDQQEAIEQMKQKLESKQ